MAENRLLTDEQRKALVASIKADFERAHQSEFARRIRMIYLDSDVQAISSSENSSK